jgi:hypothetical protein
VQLRRKAYLTVNYAIERKVLDKLARDTNQLITMLHHLQRQVDAQQEIRQVQAKFGRHKCGGQWFRKCQPDLPP